MRRTGPPHPVEDLREKLNRKRQEKAQQNAAGDATADSTKRNSYSPPPDPRSFLRDPLRGDEITKDAQVDNRQRVRGYRGRGGQGHKPLGSKAKPLNIRVEFSNPGERTCTIDESLEVHSSLNSKQGRGHYRGRRNFRGSPRNRGSYGGRNRGNRVPNSYDVDKNFESQEVDNRQDKPGKQVTLPSIETTEDWTPNECRGAMEDKIKDGTPSLKTTEDCTSGDCEEIGDNLKDSSDQHESMRLPKNNAEDFSSSLEETGKEEKVKDKHEDKINKCNCESKSSETDSVTD